MERLNILMTVPDATNEGRELIADNMHLAGNPDAKFHMTAGGCAADSNRMENGDLAFVSHGKAHTDKGRELEHSVTAVRTNGVKPRTNKGWTGLIHQPGGPELYREGAAFLQEYGTLIAAEVMDESDYAIAAPYLSMAWIGARNKDDTGPRHLLRPTSEDINNGVAPIPTFVKSGEDGGLEGTINALATLLSEKPETRSRLTLAGLRHVTTHANPHVGVILAGSKERPAGLIKDILAEEILNARAILDVEFGKDRVPIHVDVSHRHAKWEGGGESGQLIVAQALGELIIEGVRIDGVMAETYVLAGNQPAGGTTAGLSWTDACIRQEKALDMQGTFDKVWGNRLKPLAA